MGLYKDSSFSALSAIDEGDIVPVGDYIYVEIAMDTDADVNMFVRSCVATPDKDVTEPSWPFFQNG